MRLIYQKTKLTLVVTSMLMLFVFNLTSSCFCIENKTDYLFFLEEVIKDSFGGMKLMVNDRTGLPYDIVNSETLDLVDSKTSPTEIGQWMVAIVIAWDTGLIDKYQAQSKIIKVLDTLERIPKYKGFLFQWYNAKTGKNISDFVPSIDNLNFDACLIIVANAFRKENPLIHKRLKKLLDRKDYGYFSKKIKGKLCWINHGYYKNKSNYSSYDYGHFFTEIGLSVIPILNNEVTENVLVTTQVPTRESKLLKNNYSNKIGISWDGSLFNALYPYLFLGWDVLHESIKINLEKYVDIHIKYSEKFDLPFWGWSSAWGSRGDTYVPWGVPELADWGGGYGVKKVVSDKGYDITSPEVTPYSSFLVAGVLDVRKEQFKTALDNLMKIKQSGFGYDEYGFYDSLNLKEKKFGKYKVSLDEGINIIGAYNALRHLQGEKGIEGYFWDNFESQEYNKIKKMLSSLGENKFLKLCKSKEKTDIKLDPNKLVSLDVHTVSKGGWGAGLASCVSEETFFEKEGKVWQLKYNIMKDFGGGYIKLYNLKPLRKYNYLTLKVKADSESTKAFQVEIKEDGVTYPPVLKSQIRNVTSKEWKKYVIPIRFNDSDKRGKIVPSELTIVFDSNMTKSKSGSVYISDICFYKK